MKKIFVLIAALVPVGIIGLVSCLGVSAQTTDTSSNATKQYNALWIPPILEGTTTATGTMHDLTLAKSSRQLLTGNATATYGYNGNDFWRPTLVMKKGAAITLNLTNKLSEDTTTHWHGLHLPAEMDAAPIR